ncbi:MAG TPA: helix-turn-helix transcriptional regulator [Candidatus Binataceae bacterium]|nr:helix-turn-helix transcriptional regulator [Candidatus Binataceae bacterium]
MASKKAQRSLGQMLRERRRKLDLTQLEVAQRIGTSTPYIGHLEAGKRHPSDKVIGRLAEVLGFEGRELFFAANPRAIALMEPPSGQRRRSAWEEFKRDARLHRVHAITEDELDLLGRVAKLGDAGSSRDFIYILTTIRHALNR